MQKIIYSELNHRQKEAYSFQKISAILADYGITTMRLSNDWNGADFIAIQIDGITAHYVQQKSRLAFWKKYQGKNLFMAFLHNQKDCYYYPHDELFNKLKNKSYFRSASWTEKNGYTIGHLSKELLQILEPYKIGTCK